jgi:hypothetical protein
MELRASTLNRTYTECCSPYRLTKWGSNVTVLLSHRCFSRSGNCSPV